MKPTRLKILPNRLVVASLKKDQLPSCTYAILKLLVSRESGDHFFSFTDTTSEISLVLEDKWLQEFPKDVLQTTDQRWRAMKFDEESLGFESTGIISSIAVPLAKAKVCIYYVSTCNTGYTLVEQESVFLATSALKNAGFTFSNEEICSSITASGTHSQILSTSSPSVLRNSSETAPDMVISILPYKLFMATLDKKDVSKSVQTLVRLFFYPERTSRFFSFTETEDEISLFLDGADTSQFPEGSLKVYSAVWRALQICEGSYGFHGSETISKFAKPLADANISIFNLSTNETDYTLVEETNMDKSLEGLRKHLTIITDEAED